jgi:hypothetical protein
VEETFGTLAGGGEAIVGRQAVGRGPSAEMGCFHQARRQQPASAGGANVSPDWSNVRLMCFSIISVMFNGDIFRGRHRLMFPPQKLQRSSNNLFCTSRGRLHRF